MLLGHEARLLRQATASNEAATAQHESDRNKRVELIRFNERICAFAWSTAAGEKDKVFSEIRPPS